MVHILKTQKKSHNCQSNNVSFTENTDQTQRDRTLGDEALGDETLGDEALPE